MPRGSEDAANLRIRVHGSRFGHRASATDCHRRAAANVMPICCGGLRRPSASSARLWCLLRGTRDCIREIDVRSMGVTKKGRGPKSAVQNFGSLVALVEDKTRCGGRPCLHPPRSRTAKRRSPSSPVSSAPTVSGDLAPHWRRTWLANNQCSSQASKHASNPGGDAKSSHARIRRPGSAEKRCPGFPAGRGSFSKIVVRGSSG